MSNQKNPENKGSTETAAIKFDTLSKRDQLILRRYLSTSEENHSPGGLYYQDTLKLLKKYNDIKYKSYETRYESLYSYLEANDFLPKQTEPSYSDLLERQDIYISFKNREQRIHEETLVTIIELLARIDIAFGMFAEKEDAILVETINVSFINQETCTLSRDEKAKILDLTPDGYHKRIRTAVKHYSQHLWGPDGENHDSYFAEAYIDAE